MLPKEFLEVRRVKGRIYPRFADERDYHLAEKIISLFTGSKGKKYGKVLEAAKKLENSKNFRKVRGLMRIMENLCIEKACAFDVSPELPDLDPVRVRMHLFEKGYVTSKRERKKVIEFAAKYFNTTPENIEKAMYADREEELVILNVRKITPDELIKHYNLSLLQTSIFNSVRITFWTSSNHKEIFRRIKWLGLMYELYDEGNKTLVEVTGAASVIKMTRRYGTAMAKLVPSIIKAENWWMRAEIVEDARVYILEMDDRKRDLFPKYDEKVEYDSSLEEEFSWKLRALGYEVLREPEVVKAGKYAFIPDFVIRKRDSELYVEIAGFWTPEYLEKKVEKIQKSKPSIPLILIARRELGSSEGFLKEDWESKGNVSIILFSEKLPYTLVIREISRMLKKQGETKILQAEINLESVVDIKDFSETFGISVREAISRLPEDYIIAGRWAVKRDVFENLKKEIEDSKPEKLSDVKTILAKYGVGNDALPTLGYRVRWRGLSEDDALLERIACKDLKRFDSP